MFTKLDMINSKLVLTSFIKSRHDDVISDITVDRFRLEFSVFWTCEYYNLISSHQLFTKLDLVDIQPLLANLMEWRHDDVISDVSWPVSTRI